MISYLFYRTLRQFVWVEHLTETILSKIVLTSYGYVQPFGIKLLEGCIEAPLQLYCQIFIIVAGQAPGKQITQWIFKNFKILKLIVVFFKEFICNNNTQFR